MLSAALLLAACSDSREPEVPEVDILSRFNAEGKAYLTLQIPLGDQTMTRTTFDDGVGDEWKVKDVHLLIFAGTSEATAKFASAYKVESPSLNPSPNQQITRTVTIPIDDQNLNTGDKLYVFALLNNNTSAITSFSKSSVTFASGTTITTNSTLADLQAITIADYKDASNYFLMTNAPLASANDGTGTLTTLVEVPATYFFPTEAEALANPGGQIHVERLASKTTVTNGITSYYILGNSYAQFVAGDLSFALDNYNTSSYAVRYLSTAPYSRMVETSPLPNYKYRTYWAEDANYEGKSGLNYVDHETYCNYTVDEKTAFWHAMGSNVYCAENTFNVANMQDDCTTSVMVRLQLNNGLDFYTTSVTGQDIIFQLPSDMLSEEGTSASESFAPRRSNKVTYDGTNYATINDYLRTWLMQNSSAFRTWVNTYAAGEPKHVNIAVSAPAGGGTATVTGVTQTARSSGDGVSAFSALSLVSYLNNNVTLKFYDDGYCYYRVPIRHFTDIQTPWSSIPSMTNNTTAQAYSTAAATAVGGSSADAAFLGRYGMVRNNWYTINITSVTHVGYPTIPVLTTNADDTVEQLLNATLSISGWTQNNQTLMP
jgi:hypothetical protein